MFKPRTFTPDVPVRPLLTRADLWLLLTIIGLLALVVGIAERAPATVQGPEISLSLSALPFYAIRSVGRMAIAYALSFLFTMVYGYIAAYNARAERILIPLLDVLQSVPILSFLPVVLLGLSAILPEAWAVELTAIVLIFTSQVWNMTFAWYQSLTTIPRELREASSIFRFSRWQRFTTLEFPFGALALVWNSMMSWAGGWFFLMAAEIFTLGERDFRLPGLGAFLQTAADAGDLNSIVWGLLTLIVVIVLLDQLIWRPLLVWAGQFRIELVERDDENRSWLYDLLSGSKLAAWFGHVIGRLNDTLLVWFGRRPAADPYLSGTEKSSPIEWLAFVLSVVLIGWGVFSGGSTVAQGTVRTVGNDCPECRGNDAARGDGNDPGIALDGTGWCVDRHPSRSCCRVTTGYPDCRFDPGHSTLSSACSGLPDRSRRVEYRCGVVDVARNTMVHSV